MDNFTITGFDDLLLFNWSIKKRSPVDSFNDHMVERRIFHIILLTLIVTFNLALLFYFVKKKHDCLSKPDRSFILHLAIADILYAFFVIAPLLKWEFTNEHNIGDFFCKCVLYLQEAITTSGAYIVCAMSVYSLNIIESVRAPSVYCTGPSPTASLFGAWMLSILITIPVFIISRETLSDEIVNDQYHCQIHILSDGHWQVYISVKATVQFFIPFIIMTTCYSIIASKMCKRKPFQFIQSKEKCNDTYQRQNSDISTLQNESILLKITFILCIVYICTTAPYYIQELIDVHHELTVSQRLITQSTVILCLHQTPPVIYPLVYVCFLFHRKSCSCIGIRKKNELLNCTPEAEKPCISLHISSERSSNPGSTTQSCNTTLDEITTDPDV